MIEEQVQEVVLAIDHERVLSPQEGKALAQLKQKPRDLRHQLVLDIALHRLGAEGQKVEHIWVFQDLLNQLGLRRRQGLSEVAYRQADALVKALLNLPLQHRAAPAMFGAGLGVQQHQIYRLHLSQQGAQVPQGICPTGYGTTSKRGLKKA